MSMIKYRVHEVAKDFNSTSKVISQILTDYATTPKNHMQVLENDELDLIFEYLTQHNQVGSIAEIFNTPAQAENPSLPRKSPQRMRNLQSLLSSLRSLPLPLRRRRRISLMSPDRWPRSVLSTPVAAQRST